MTENDEPVEKNTVARAIIAGNRALRDLDIAAADYRFALKLRDANFSKPFFERRIRTADSIKDVPENERGEVRLEVISERARDALKAYIRTIGPPEESMSN